MNQQYNSILKNFGIRLEETEIDEILGLLKRSLIGGRWVLGPATEELEAAFAEWSGRRYARALSTGGAALVAVLQGLEIPEGSIVICPTLTAPPTIHAALLAGMRVVFVDSSPDDLAIDPEDLQRRLDHYGDAVKAVITVHVGGYVSTRLDRVAGLCAARGVFLIEDCAHAHGARLNGVLAGSAGVAATYSFFMTKPLSSGEGGMVTTESARLHDAIGEIKNYGKTAAGAHVRPGFNYRISEFNAAIALWATRHADQTLDRRRALARAFDELLVGIRGVSPIQVPGCEPSYYKYVVMIADGRRNEVRARLYAEYGIEPVGSVYDTPCHQEPYFRSIPNRILNAADAFRGAEAVASNHLCLTLYPGMERSDVERVVSAVRAVTCT